MEDQIDVVRKTEMMWFMAAGRQNDVICGAEGKHDVVPWCVGLFPHYAV